MQFQDILKKESEKAKRVMLELSSILTDEDLKEIQEHLKKLKHTKDETNHKEVLLKEIKDNVEYIFNESGSKSSWKDLSIKTKIDMINEGYSECDTTEYFKPVTIEDGFSCQSEDCYYINYGHPVGSCDCMYWVIMTDVIMCDMCFDDYHTKLSDITIEKEIIPLFDNLIGMGG